MSLLAMGLSHRSAPLTVLEQVALDAEGVRELARAALQGEHVSESVVLATCNRVEVYADVTTFHGGLADLGQALSATAGVPLDDLKDHLYVHYADRAAAHLFSVACGLDSMAVGESQVLGQLRHALRLAQDNGDTGRVLDHLVQRALRVGKRAHSETGIDRAGASLVGAGLRRAERSLGPLDELAVLVVGAGSMSALAATTAHRAGVASLTISNRTCERAQRLAQATDAAVLGWEDLPSGLAAADVVISCTGAIGHVIDLATATASSEQHRASRGGAQLYVDLALPRDVDPLVAELAAVEVADLEVLGHDLAGAEISGDVLAVRDLVEAEVEDYLTAVRMQSVAPVVVALRARAAEVVESELSRLDHRLPNVAPQVREELQRTVHRVVEKLLHAPTVRVKELASRQDGTSYASALRELFDLLPEDVTTVSDVPMEQDIAAVLTGRVTVQSTGLAPIQRTGEQS